MAGTGLTPDEYSLHLQDLKARMEAFLDKGEGDLRRLLHDAEELVGMRDEFPEVYERYPDIEGLCCGVLARRQQMRVMGGPQEKEAPGCLFGWLARRKRT